MKIVKLKGGLGNQMFQYSFAKALEKMTNDSIKLDLSSYNHLENDQVRKPRILKFNISLPIATQEDIANICLMEHENSGLNYKSKALVVFEMLFNHRYFFEIDRSYRNIVALQKYNYYDGYWQSWKHVESVIEEVRKDFTPRADLNEKTKRFIEEVEKCNSVFLGIRKGDYSLEEKHYGSYGQDYFSNAMKYIDEKVESPVYYVFSNDIEWVKNNIDFENRHVIVRENKDVESDFEELLIMSSCVHSSIVNRTFYWWGAKLKEHDGKIVIAPKRWFFDKKKIDIVPPQWIKL